MHIREQRRFSCEPYARHILAGNPPEAVRVLNHQLSEGAKFMTAKSPARIAVLAALAVGVAGCGYNRGDRALSGGAIGAAGGAIIGAAAFGNPGAGALI